MGSALPATTTVQYSLSSLTLLTSLLSTLTIVFDAFAYAFCVSLLMAFGVIVMELLLFSPTRNAARSHESTLFWVETAELISGGMGVMISR
jgi:hypothetical protein